MVIARQKESNLLKYNVAGDCLAIKLEGEDKFNFGAKFLGPIFKVFSALGRISGIFCPLKIPFLNFCWFLVLFFFICSLKG